MTLLNSPKRIAAVVVVLTLLGTGIRLFRLDNQSFWTDETSSVLTARVPLDQISERSGENNCLPTYFLILHQIIGNSNDQIEFKARLLSALAGALAVPLFIGVVQAWRKRWDTALLAGLALAINPLHLWYSQEVRAYALMLLFGLGALFAFERARERHFAWWLLYFVLAISAMATHKTGLTFALFCVLRQGVEFLRARRNVAALCVHVAVILAGGILLNLKSAPPPKEYVRPGSILEIVYTAITFLGGYSFGPSLTDIQSHGPAAAVSRHLVQVGILGVVLALFGVAYMGRWRALFLSNETGLLLLGIGIVVAGSLVSHFAYNVRYALPALFGFLALAAAMVERPVPPVQSKSEKGPRLSCFLGCGMLIVSLWADAQWFFKPNYRKADSRAVAQWLVNHQKQVNSWTVLPDYLAVSIQWYLEPYPEIRSRFLPPKEPQATSFPPVPDVLIIGRRHHVPQADQIVHSYCSLATNVQAVHSFVGFELFVSQR